MADELDRRAAFAANFVDGTTNLAQRRRYQEDIAAAEEAELMENQERFDRSLYAASVADPIKAEELRLRERGQNLARERFYDQQRATTSRFDKEMSLKERKFALDQNKAKIAEQRMRREMDVADRLQVQSNNVEQGLFEMQNNNIRRGSEAGANAVVSLLLQNPDIPRELRASILQDWRVDVDPDELDFMMGMAPEGSRLSVSRSPNGMSWTISPPLAGTKPTTPKPVDREKERRELETEYLNVVKAFNNEGDAPTKAYWEKRAQEMRKRLNEFDNPAPSASPAATVPGVSASATAAVPTAQTQKPIIKAQFKDGKVVTQ